MSAAPRLLGLVVEGPDDARTVPGLTDRILAHEVPTPEGALGRVRAFQGLRAGEPFLAWSAVAHEARHGRVPRRHGHFGGEPAIEDARTAWYALQCFVGEDPPPAAVLLVRDSDGKLDERVRGLEQARGDRDWPFPVVIGVAHPMRECWALAGFIPQSKGEKATLAALRKELGFDPTVASARLGASKETAKKSPKRVLSRLTGSDGEREAQCWTATDLEHLRERGADNGLAAFMSEVEERLVPIIAG
jgi:hypothetical protein